MNKKLFLFAAASVALAATAQNTNPSVAPRLEFRAIPFEGAPVLEHKVTPYRIFDKMIVTVWDPVACGQKPINPAFSIQGNKLYLSYSLTPAVANAKSCTLLSQFDVHDVPHRELEVNFAGGPEPYTVASLKTCPGYKPSTDDIWACLAPAAK